MSTIAAGAIGSLITIVVAFAARLATVPREVAAHDRRVAEREEDLSQWVADRDVWLRRRLDAARAKLAARGMLQSGEYGFRLGLLKEAALHEYRDQQRQAERDVDLIYDAEGWLHGAWRAIRRQPRRALNAPERVEPVLAAWRAPLTRGGTTAPIDDPTDRPLERAIDQIDESAAAYE